MHFPVKLLENVRKNMFPEKQTTNKVPLRFLDVKDVNGKVTIGSVDCAKKQATCSACV